MYAMWNAPHRHIYHRFYIYNRVYIYNRLTLWLVTLPKLVCEVGNVIISIHRYSRYRNRAAKRRHLYNAHMVVCVMHI